MQKSAEKLTIIGAGPAGLTAAIYAARGDLHPVVVTGHAPGGQLMLTTDVDDFPGFPQGVQGSELMSLVRAQAEKFGTRFILEEVVSVNLKTHPFTVKTTNQTFKTQSIILASGASAMWLGLPSEQRLIGRGVSSCAVCDGPFYKNKKVVIIGGGDAAMREAQHLSKYAREVVIIHRRDTLRAQKALQELIENKSNVSVMLNTFVTEVLGEEKVVGVKVRNTITDEQSVIETDGMFLAIGHQPNTKFLEGQLKLDERGYIIVSEETKTSIPGVFVAGDVADYKYRQAVTAAGSGAKAALDVEEYLEKELKV